MRPKSKILRLVAPVAALAVMALASASAEAGGCGGGFAGGGQFSFTAPQAFVGGHAAFVAPQRFAVQRQFVAPQRVVLQQNVGHGGRAFVAGGSRTPVRNFLFGRPRVVVGF